MDKKELVWVSAELAERYKKLGSDEARYQVFEEYLDTISKQSNKDFRANLDGLEEDVAIYTGLMFKVKQAFEKAKNEQLSASYDLWERFEDELPSTNKKIDRLISVIDPLVAKLETVNHNLKRIDTFNVERLIKLLADFEQLSDKGQRIFDFVCQNFKE